MREQLRRWWARKKVKAARLLGSRADNKCGTSQTDSNVRQRGFTPWLLLSGALTLLLGSTWWAGFLNEYLWPPERVVLSIENFLWGPPPRPEDRFRVVLCWLENDKSGDDTQIVEQAFQSVSGIELVRSSLSIRASGAADDWQPAMQEGCCRGIRSMGRRFSYCRSGQTIPTGAEPVVHPAYGRRNAGSRRPTLQVGRCDTRRGLS